MSDVNAVIVQPFKQFVKDSIHLVKKCTKPDRKEFARIASATAIGFLIMGALRCVKNDHHTPTPPSRRRRDTRPRNAGFVGFFVKLVHIPINNILMT